MKLKKRRLIDFQSVHYPVWPLNWTKIGETCDILQHFAWWMTFSIFFHFVQPLHAATSAQRPIPEGKKRILGSFGRMQSNSSVLVDGCPELATSLRCTADSNQFTPRLPEQVIDREGWKCFQGSEGTYRGTSVQPQSAQVQVAVEVLSFVAKSQLLVEDQMFEGKELPDETCFELKKVAPFHMLDVNIA